MGFLYVAFGREIRLWGVLLVRSYATNHLKQSVENSVYNWPKHFPSQCPPATAEEAIGIVYRFINGNNPNSKDFISHYERDPIENNNCQARGLSVLRSFDACEIMRQGVPALRRKKIALGTLPNGVGVIKITPSVTCSEHYTWWRFSKPESISPLFKTFNESTGDKQ